jgi:hypothetical protein
MKQERLKKYLNYFRDHKLPVLKRFFQLEKVQPKTAEYLDVAEFLRQKFILGDPVLKRINSV